MPGGRRKSGVEPPHSKELKPVQRRRAEQMASARGPGIRTGEKLQSEIKCFGWKGFAINHSSAGQKLVLRRLEKHNGTQLPGPFCLHAHAEGIDVFRRSLLRAQRLRQTGKQYLKPLVAPFFFPALYHRATRQVELLAVRVH